MCNMYQVGGKYQSSHAPINSCLVNAEASTSDAHASAPSSSRRRNVSTLDAPKDPPVHVETPKVPDAPEAP